MCKAAPQDSGMKNKGPEMGMIWDQSWGTYFHVLHP